MSGNHTVKTSENRNSMPSFLFWANIEKPTKINKPPDFFSKKGGKEQETLAGSKKDQRQEGIWGNQGVWIGANMCFYLEEIASGIRQTLSSTTPNLGITLIFQNVPVCLLNKQTWQIPCRIQYTVTNTIHVFTKYTTCFGGGGWLFCCFPVEIAGWGLCVIRKKRHE